MKFLPFVFAIFIANAYCASIGGDALIDTLENLELEGLEVPKKVFNVVKNHIKEIDQIVKEGEEAIKRLEEYTGEALIQKAEFTKHFYNNFTIAKSKIREARQELFSLAERTRLRLPRLNWSLNNYDTIDKDGIKWELRKFKKLLDLCMKKLGNAKSLYNEAMTSFEKAAREANGFKVRIEKLLDKESAEFNSWEKKARAVAYGSATGVTVLMAILDGTVCFGACSAIGTSIAWATSATSVEATIAVYTSNMENMKDIVDDFTNKLETMDSKINSAIEFLSHELNLILRWDDRVADSYEVIEDFTSEKFPKYARYREDIKISLGELEDIVLKFLKQPLCVFGKNC